MIFLFHEKKFHSSNFISFKWIQMTKLLHFNRKIFHDFPPTMTSQSVLQQWIPWYISFVNTFSRNTTNDIKLYYHAPKTASLTPRTVILYSYLVVNQTWYTSFGLGETATESKGFITLKAIFLCLFPKSRSCIALIYIIVNSPKPLFLLSVVCDLTIE